MTDKDHNDTPAGSADPGRRFYFAKIKRNIEK